MAHKPMADQFPRLWDLPADRVKIFDRVKKNLRCSTQQTATLEQVHAAQADAGGKQQSGRMRQVRARRRQ